MMRPLLSLLPPASKPMIDDPMVDLPDPLSPTRATVLPRGHGKTHVLQDRRHAPAVAITDGQTFDRQRVGHRHAQSPGLRDDAGGNQIGMRRLRNADIRRARRLPRAGEHLVKPVQSIVDRNRLPGAAEASNPSIPPCGRA